MNLAPQATRYSESAIIEQLQGGARPGDFAREYVDRVRVALFQRHQAGAGGLEIVHDFAAAMDCLLRAIFRYADSGQGKRFPRLQQRLTVVARGGYGRSELNAYSDVDLLFLHDYKPGPYLEVVAETILHALWDAGLVIGYSVRNASDCIKMAAADLKEKTAILDARLLAGDEELYARFEQSLVSDVLNRDQQNFFKAKLEESRERHRHYGDSVYLLEPQLKEGEGGLRDLHTALWLAKVKYRIRSLPELVQRAIVTDAEMGEVTGAQDFLLRLRNALHFASRRHTDQLTFEFQEQIAPTLGFCDGDGFAASAHLMRAYYQQASTILRFSEGLIARVTEDMATSRFFRRIPGRQIRSGVIIQSRVLGIADSQLFKRAPLNLIAIFADCQAHGVELSGNTYQLVRDHLALIDERMRQMPETGAALMRILSARHRVADTLEAMHRAGVLGAIIPEFGNLYARVLHDLYHIYTVDRHSLAAVRELERLRAGEFKDSNSLLTEVAREYDALPVVFLALLLHDIGKGYGHDHHERGAVLAAEVCKRLGRDSEETDLVVFLVHEHLTMSQVAQKGDVNDERTVTDFARLVGSIDRLKALYLLTFADMRAVAPSVYNNWRDMLLSDLYMKTLKLLEQGDREAVDPERRLALVKAAVREQLSATNASAREISDFLELMPERYFLTVPETDIGAHFEAMRGLGERRLVCRHRHFPDLEFSEFIVITADEPGLFSKIAGVLTANYLNILSARITTRADGIALDVFHVSHLQGARTLAMEEDRWLRVEYDLERVLNGDQDIAALVASTQRSRLAGRKFVRRVPTEITVDNRSSERFTVVDVFTQDRVGLLFAITHTLFELGYIIHLARISTNADQALDVFYISDGGGNKILELERMRALRAGLTERLEEEPSGMEATPANPPIVQSSETRLLSDANRGSG
ncbi:MAG: [protein-PII] uridylyltransferase [Deltaproteobacteria bacterium]|nr:[protein-PII] uridylyltransferase [Deltaproteobacteria bacterium]